MTTDPSDCFSTMVHSAIVPGHCVIFDADRDIVYVGPIPNSPDTVAGWLIVLHPDDLKKLSNYVDANSAMNH